MTSIEQYIDRIAEEQDERKAGAMVRYAARQIAKLSAGPDREALTERLKLADAPASSGTRAPARYAGATHAAAEEVYRDAHERAERFEAAAELGWRDEQARLYYGDEDE